ncbi:cytochrome C [Rhodanobacter sp. B05]|uniref:c-type cytochrome n=1 Tax=Rhodanobacter sp. B05 TaxID=1945859 RepID=UPI0009865A4C|nr:cytochrome c [Rhodanobacter sp. B05]OOG55098.1 cytochrome C [Rhodanobacter sp. B05]
MNASTCCLLLLGLLATASVHAADSTDAALLQRGQYLATAGDCVACHTAPAGKPFAGGLTVPTPIGNIIATNITPSATAGIGHYTEQQFSDALRKGIRADGKRLYPAMPYTAYAQITDDDVHALYAYFMHDVAPVDSKPAPTRLPFPFNIRLSMAAWNLLFLDSKPFAPDPGKSADWNRGAYLVRGLAHCSTCHTPRNLLMAEQSSRELAGGAVGTWLAPNITSDANSSIGGWSEEDLVDYLKLGHARGKAQAAGPMAEAVEHSLQHLEPADLQAIATYLKTVPARHDPADIQAVDSWGAAFDGVAEQRGTPFPDDAEKWSGAQLYDAHCASCHQARGEGSFDGGLPPLFHNTATGRARADNLVLVILEGIHWTDASGVHMPAFANDLSDQQIATLANYLTRHYGNPAATVDAARVGVLRAGGAPSHLVALARLALAVIALLIVLVIVLRVRRRRRRASAGRA